MRVRLFVLAGLFAILFASCAGPSTAPASTAVPNPTATSVPHAPEIRFALIGTVTDVNVWALFDAKGYSYNNYALRNEYWPRLYRLSILERQFEPMAASGMPSSVQQEGKFYTATVPLRPDLKWTDGFAFTADDVAFTVNTALSFQLGFDWHDFYNPDYLDHAQALDAHTVKFFFKKQPNVGVWQYGVLQGPVVQSAYWGPKIAASFVLLLGNSPATPQANPDNAMKAARESLYAVSHDNEPTLGNWIPAGQQNGAWINKVNPAHPFGEPKFDQAAYQIYADWKSGESDFAQNKVDVLLNPDGYIAFPPRQMPPTYPTNLVGFLVFGQKQTVLADPNLRKAITCINKFPYDLSSTGFNEFVLAGPWQNNISFPKCSGLSDAVEILQAAGYSWMQKPTNEQAGKGLILPNGKHFPPITLLTTNPDDDVVRSNAALFLALPMQNLGIPVTVKNVDRESLHYTVFSSGDYDMAILSWRLSEYPGYLCDWFGDGNPFHYDGSRLKSACETLYSTTDLETAHQASFNIQSVLMEDFPFIPLYQIKNYNGFRNVTYPFDSILGGLSGVYGAPSLASPAP